MEKLEVGEIFTIIDEKDQEDEVEVLATATINDRQYIAVGLVDDIQSETEDDIDIYFLKVEENGELAPIGSQEEFNKVSKVFDEFFKDED
ncbi:DUF1292 domain-containing protein [Calidifontibacillus erzurumensis]|uniref:DUF1292 domain-containing protein n=1 Tax=Calidifontibacillus erzurumensis TaxID=2741433 RepID=A0A8J8GFG6_9BACI|nr:DUF1292 domain-containing protein [Calidifontibacillus erzurumensis]NSL50818.1 DUF1292 domain-containing protein [Calidifontibacillus erzurumensis]